MPAKKPAHYRGAASRNRPLRGATGYCEKHRRRYELYRGCGECECEMPRPELTEAERIARRIHQERVQAAIDAGHAKEQTNG